MQHPQFRIGETVTLTATNWTQQRVTRPGVITDVVRNPHSRSWTYSGRGWVAPEAVLLRDNPRGNQKEATTAEAAIA